MRWNTTQGDEQADFNGVTLKQKCCPELGTDAVKF
jgi:hypothetical protein